MRQLLKLSTSRTCAIIYFYLLVIGASNAQTDTTILKHDNIAFPQPENSYTIPGVGSHQYYDFLFEIELIQDQQYASLKLYNTKGGKTLIIEIDSIKEISKVHSYKENHKDILTFSVFSVSIDRHNSGRAYVLERGSEIKIFSRAVNNSSSPILVNGFILVMESLDLKLFDIKLNTLVKRYSVIHQDLLKNNNSYLDSYSVAGLEYFKSKLFIDFSKDTFNSDYFTYCGSTNFGAKGDVIMLVD